MELFENLYKLIESWEPKEKYRSEKRYISDLREYLYQSLNDYSDGFSKKKINVKVQKEKESCDLLIDNLVGIELKKTMGGKIPKQKIDRIFEELLMNRDVHKRGVIFILVGNKEKEVKKYLEERINKFFKLTQVKSPLRIFRRNSYGIKFIDKSY